MIGGNWLDLILFLALVAVVSLLWWRGWIPRGLAARRAEGEAGEERDEGAPEVYRGYARWARQAGFEPTRLYWLYWGSKIFLLLLLPLLLFDLLGGPWWAALLLAAFGFFLPDLGLLLIRRRRQREIVWGLSFFVDLLVALLHAGLGLDTAFRRAGREGFDPDHPLAQEVALVSAELSMGEERMRAFGALGERTGVSELRSLAAALQSGIRHGAPLQTILEDQADLLRVKRREETRKRISTAGVKILFPIFLCGFPVFLVVVFFPAVMEMTEVLIGILGQF